jgi:homoaconitate hydratase
VAASAAAGYIRGPGPAPTARPRHSVTTRPEARESRLVEVLPAFPARVTGRTLWLPADSITTDGIYAGTLTYRDDVPPAEMAAAAFANYDPGFQGLVHPGAGDIVVAGRTFGAGSSREQAATCLIHLGIAAVVAASFSETYKRNALNNGLVVLECPDLVAYLREHLGGQPGQTLIGPTLTIDYRQSLISADGHSFPFPPLSQVAQALVIAGGAENVVRQRLGLPPLPRGTG